MSEQSAGIPTEPWLIDVHQHFFPEIYQTALNNAGINIFELLPWLSWDLQSALDFMDQSLIKKAYLSITDPGIHFGDNPAARKLARSVNEAGADLIRSHPDRFGCWAILPLPDVDGSLEEIEYSLDTLGLGGVVLMSTQNDGSYLGDAKYDSIMEELDRRNAIVFVHPSTPFYAKDLQIDYPPPLAEFVFDTSRAILNLVWSGAAHRYKNIKYIFSHAGGTLPYISWRCAGVMDNLPRKDEFFPLGAMEYFKRFNYDLTLSSAPYSLAGIQEMVPNSQLFFGSDFPYAPSHLREKNNEMFNTSKFLSDQDRLLIGSTNVRSLLART